MMSSHSAARAILVPHELRAREGKMSEETLLPLPVPPPPAPGRFVRIEYLDFQDAPEYREFRLRVCGSEGSTEFKVRIAIEEFGPGRLGLQDGPAICYEKLRQVVAQGETASPDVITIDATDLATYREAHTKVQKHRSWTPTPSPTPTVPVGLPRAPRTSFPRLPVAPVATRAAEPAFDEGQRVSHAVFGAGVTTSSTGGHTVVHFDQDGSKTFVTSMLKVDVLSAPHTWETDRRGKNRLCRTPAPRG